MDTEYLFLCPKCKKITICIGSGDALADSVRCKGCNERFIAYYCGNYSEILPEIKSQINVKKKIEKFYTTCKFLSNEIWTD